MANGNGNRQWTIWIAGLLGTIILATLTMTIKSVVANDAGSRDRDTSIEFRITDKIETNQKEIREEMKIVRDNQSTLIARQNMVIDTLKEIKAKIQ